MLVQGFILELVLPSDAHQSNEEALRELEALPERTDHTTGNTCVIAQVGARFWLRLANTTQDNVEIDVWIGGQWADTVLLWSNEMCFVKGFNSAAHGGEFREFTFNTNTERLCAEARFHRILSFEPTNLGGSTQPAPSQTQPTPSSATPMEVDGTSAASGVSYYSTTRETEPCQTIKLWLCDATALSKFSRKRKASEIESTQGTTSGSVTAESISAASVTTNGSLADAVATGSPSENGNSGPPRTLSRSLSSELFTSHRRRAHKRRRLHSGGHQADQPCPIAALSDALLQRIFDALDGRVTDLCRAEMVCSNWHRVLRAANSVFWPTRMRLSFDGCGHVVKYSLIDRLVARVASVDNTATALTDLDLSRTRVTAEEIVRLVGSRTPHLRRLWLAECQNVVGHNVVVDITAVAPQLELLDLSKCPLGSCDGARANRCAANALSTSSTNSGPHFALKKLSLHKCGVSTVDVLQYAVRFPNMESIDLWDCPVGDAAVVGTPDVPGLARENLREVTLSGTHVTDLSVAALASKCPHLTAFVARRCLGITDEGMSALLGNHSVARHSLKVVDLWGGDARITDATLVAMATPNTAAEMSTWRLCELVMAQCRITDSGLTSLPFHAMPFLEVVCLRRCVDITDDGVHAVVMATNGRLRALDVWGCTRLSENAFRGILFSNAAPNIRHLSLAECNVGTASFMAALCAACPQLEELSLRRCVRLTDNAAVSLSTLCRLRELDLWGCAAVGDDAVVAISRKCRDLRTLVLAETAVTSRGLVALFAEGNLPFLENLSLRRCRGVDDTALRAVAARFAEADGTNAAAPHLTSVDFSATAVTKPAIAELHRVGALDWLKEIDVSYCPNIAVSPRATRPRPQTAPLDLGLDGVQIGMRGAVAMATIVQLRTMDSNEAVSTTTARSDWLPATPTPTPSPVRGRGAVAKATAFERECERILRHGDNVDTASSADQRFVVTATVKRIQPAVRNADAVSGVATASSLYYIACPTCHRKLDAAFPPSDDDRSAAGIADVLMTCPVCDVAVDRTAADPRFALAVWLVDHTGDLWVRAFDSAAQVLLGASAGHLEAIVRSGLDDMAEEIVDEALLKTWKVTLMRKRELWNGRWVAKYVITNATPVNFTTDASHLLAEIERLRKMP